MNLFGCAIKISVQPTAQQQSLPTLQVLKLNAGRQNTSDQSARSYDPPFHEAKTVLILTFQHDQVSVSL